MFKKISLISLSLVNLLASTVFSQENQNVSKAYYKKTEYSSIMKEYPRIGGLHGNWPYTGFGCITQKDDYLYFVTRQQVYYYNYANYKCGRTSKLVSVIKAYKTTKNIVSRLDLYSRSDDTVSCGIYDDTLYFIGANKNDCQNYNYDSHITLVNLNTFSHKHRYLFKNFANIPTFQYSHEEQTSVTRNKYINYPYSSYLHDKYLFISFHHEYSGVWVLDLSKENVVIEHSFQPIQRITTSFYNETTDEEEEQEEDVPVNFFKDILYLDDKLFVISDNDNDNANVNIFNITAMNETYSNINHIETKELTDVISIRDIKLDPLNKRFYTLSGKTSSEIYRFDENMTKIVAQSSCDKDFIKIPNEISMIYRIEIDYNTGHLYFIISHNSYFNGVASLRLVDFSLGDFEIYKFNNYGGMHAQSYGTSTNNYQLWGNNITYFSKDDGQLIVATYMNYYKRFVVIDLIGCSEGLGIVRTEPSCVICETGKHSNEIGGTCIGCDYGYSTQKKGSLECEECQSGLYADSIGSVSCFSCQTGYYSDIPGSTSCKACESGKYSIVTASKTIEDCDQCDSGKISQIGADDCTSCQIGKFELNNKRCVNCPKGRFSDVPEIQGSDECKECALGKFLDITGATAETMCKICPIGKEGIETAAVSNNTCITCSIGTFQDNSDLSDPYCKDCDDGYVSKMGASHCEPCVSGKYAHNSESCMDCEVGSYSNDESLTCYACPDGFVSSPNKTHCIECEIGKYAFEARKCISCPKGKYSEEERITSEQSCVSCEIGKWNDNLGSNTEDDCRDCTSGRYSDISALTNIQYCKNCEAGFYTNAFTAATECLQCPDGFISEKKATECDECRVGKWADSRQRCVDCEKGKYGDQEHQISKLSCTDCPAGKWDDTLASSTILSCKNCPHGTFNKNTGESNPDNCVECRVGEYSEFLEGSTKCDSCPEGFISARGSTQCVECEKGKWADNKHRCVDCVKGKYGDELHQTTDTSCKDCPAGKWDDTLASATILSCKNCPAGKFNKNTGESKADNCVFCSAGQYAAVPEGASHCIECPNGFVSSIDNIRCIECDTGKWADNKQSCVNCVEGKYSDVRNIYRADQCKECEKGKWSDVIGASSEITCNDCIPGKFGNAKSQISNQTCIICQPGKYRSTDMLSSDECSVCENGKYSAAGADRCLDCDPGKYNSGTSANNHISCLLCSPGKYNEIYGADSEKKCKLCLEGKYSETPGLTQESLCLECPVGKYNDKKGSRFVTDCINCPAGKIRKTPGAGSIQDCIDCNPGKFSKIGATFCNDCNIGLYSNVPGAKKCEKCLEGTYTKDTNTITCKSCPDDSSQTPKADRCVCDSNTYLSGFQDEEPVCTQCTQNMICKVNTEIKDIITRRGYWRHNNSTLRIQKCRIGYACVENSITNSSDDLCNVGHMGPLCDVCMKGWAKNGGKCFNCDKSEKSRSIAFTLIVPLICILIVIFMIRTANPTTETKEPLSGVVKIFMNYAQVFSLASSFEINWPQIIIDLFETTKEFSSPRVSFYSSDCTIGWSYYDKFLVYITLPIIFVAITSVVLVYITKKYAQNREDVIMKRKPLKVYYKSMADYRKSHPAPKVFYKSWFYTATVIGTFLAWPTVIKQTLTIINCANIGDSYYLSADLSVECYTTKHKTFLVIGYLSLLFYGLFVPIFGFSLVGRHRYNLFEQNNKYEGAMPLSFLFLGYREKMWFYEAIVMLKKLGLILISVFLREIPRYQMICASLLIQFSFFLHIFLRPYDDITMYGILCNRLETLSLLALVVTLNSGLFFGTIESNYDLGSFEVVLIVLLFIMNFIVVSYFLYNMAILAVRVAKQKIKDITRKIICSNVKELDLMEVVDYDSIKFREKLLAVIKKESLIELYDWTTKKELDNHGILLKNEYERDLFNTFFTEKKKFTHNLRSEMGTMEMNKRRNSIEGSMFGSDYINLALNKLRNKIEIIEKKRCWLAILNNRLFYELRKQIMLSKLKLSRVDSDKINDIFNIYIENGVRYNRSMQELSSKALEGLQFVIHSSDSDLNNNPMFKNPMRQAGATKTNDDNEIHTIDSENGNVQLIVKDAEKSESRRSFSMDISKNVEEINNEIVTYINKTMDSMKHAVDEMII